MLHKVTCAFKRFCCMYLPRLSKVKRLMLLNCLLDDNNSPIVYETHKWILSLPFCHFVCFVSISFFNTIVNPKVVKLQQSWRETCQSATVWIKSWEGIRQNKWKHLSACKDPADSFTSYTMKITGVTGVTALTMNLFHVSRDSVSTPLDVCKLANGELVCYNNKSHAFYATTLYFVFKLKSNFTKTIIFSEP